MFADWTTGQHTGADTPITASGPGSERFDGVIDNTDVHDAIQDAQRRRRSASGQAVTPHQSAMNSASACAVGVIDGRCTRSSTPCRLSARAPKQTAGVSP